MICISNEQSLPPPGFLKNVVFKNKMYFLRTIKNVVYFDYSIACPSVNVDNITILKANRTLGEDDGEAGDRTDFFMIM